MVLDNLLLLVSSRWIPAGVHGGRSGTVVKEEKES
jgi:hypothetical protein